MRFLPLTLGLILLSAPALAQITVINEDGSKTTFNPGETATTKPAPAPKAEPEQKPEDTPKQAEQKSEPKPEPKAKTEVDPEPQPIKEQQAPAPAQKQKAEPKPAPAPKAEPKKEPLPAAPKSQPVEKPQPAEKTQAEPQHILDTIEWGAPPVPPRKPVYEQAAPTSSKSASKPIIPPSPRDIRVISQNTAIGIALDHAPPAKDFKVFANEHKGKPAYSVMFRTDDGPYEVLVDAVTGRILDKGYLQY